MANIKRSFGSTVRRRRQKMGLSQEEFAELAEIHRTYVSSIESGKVAAGIEVCSKVAKALNTPLHLLIREAETEYK
jgi:transcriptional regulator with XRE-family HTH domain